MITNKFHQTSTLYSLCIILMLLLLSGFTCPSSAANSGFQIIKVTMESTTNIDSAEPVKDFYVNAGSEDGLSESMILNVFRKKQIRVTSTGHDIDISIHVGQVKVFKLYRNIAVTRVHSLTASEKNPVLVYRTIMIGDYAVPEVKKAGSASGINTHASSVNKEQLSDTLMLPSHVLFRLSDWKLKPEALEILYTVNDMLNQSKDKDIIIEGHTCSLGTHGYNLELSRKRAQTVADYVKKTTNIPAGNIHIAYHGEQSPIASNITEEGRRKNRRVVIRFSPYDVQKS